MTMRVMCSTCTGTNQSKPHTHTSLSRSTKVLNTNDGMRGSLPGLGKSTQRGKFAEIGLTFTEISCYFYKYPLLTEWSMAPPLLCSNGQPR